MGDDQGITRAGAATIGVNKKRARVPFDDVTVTVTVVYPLIATAYDVEKCQKRHWCASSACHAFRASNSTGAMRPLDMFSIIFCTLSGVFRPIKI